MYVSIEGQGHFLTLAQGHLHIEIKTCFSKKPLSHFELNIVCKLLDTRKFLYKMLVT